MMKNIVVVLILLSASSGFSLEESNSIDSSTPAVQAETVDKVFSSIQSASPAAPVKPSASPAKQTPPPISPGQSGGRKGLLPMLKDGSPSAYVAFTQPKQTNGLIMLNPEGVTYVTEDYLGRRGVKPGVDSKEKIFYFQAAKDQLSVTTGTLFVTVTYLDKGKGALAIEYKYEDGKGKTQPRSDRVFLGDSGIWQQHSFTLAGATLDHSYPGETDFLIECPGILIHAVMMTRIPVAQQDHVTSTLFRQAAVPVPPGYEFGVVLGGKDAETMWSKDNAQQVDEKAKLYKAWGALHVVETVNISLLQSQRGALDFSLYADRMKKITERELIWTPRFKIGDVKTLPFNVVNSLQKAVGTDRPSEGPMLSIWEPRLVDIYAKVFDEMRQSINPQQLPRMVLSFAGDWGPLYFSFDAPEDNGWPDFWSGDPLAHRSFQDHLQRRYGSMNALRTAWRDETASLTAAAPGFSPDFSPIRKLDTYEWYRESLTNLIRRILEKAKMTFPQTQITIEIAEDFEFSAVDPAAIASLAAETQSSAVMIVKGAMPAKSPIWLDFASACQRKGVKFGIRAVRPGGGKEMLSTLYSLAGDGGSLFYFSEGFLVGDESWEQYSKTVPILRYVKSNPRVAVVFPRTAMTMESPSIFLRMASDLREVFGFDMVDENDLGSITAAEYPFIFVPWGSIWSQDAIAHFDRLARSGAALVVHTDKPWQNVRGDVSFNENLFAVQLVKCPDGWRMQPRSENSKPYENANAIPRMERREINLGASGDDVFLGGEWGDPENANAADRLKLPFKSFRWMGERGSISLPMLPGKEYQLQLEGFLPPGKRLQIFVNKEYVDAIVGYGSFQWTKPITGKLRSRNGDVNVLLRGQLWSMGEVLGATQSQRVSMALGKVAVVPLGEKNENKKMGMGAPGKPIFERKTLRGSWMREVGQGVTVIAPDEYVNEWVYREMVNSFVMQPILLDARYRFTLPPDGRQNEIYVKPLIGNSSVYLNLGDKQVSAGGWDRFTPIRNIPPKTIFYSN